MGHATDSGRAGAPVVQSVKSEPGTDTAIDTALRIGLLAILLYLAFMVIRPFVTILLWSALLAVLLQPLHRQLATRLSDSRAATLIGVAAVALLLVPFVLAVNAVAVSALDLVEKVEARTLSIGPPPPKLALIPVVGEKLSLAWAQAHASLPDALEQYGPVLKPMVNKLGHFAGGLATSTLSFVASLVIAAIFIAYRKPLVALLRDVATRIDGSRALAEQQLSTAESTIRSVAVGVVGVALIQAGLIGVGLFAAGVPFAALITLALLLLGIVQFPVLLLTLPIIGWVWATGDNLTPILFTIWTLLAGASDNVLKPLLLGRGSPVPMPVVLIGVIGGMILDGMVGLFLGPVLLSILWMLMLDWARPKTMVD